MNKKTEIEKFLDEQGIVLADDTEEILKEKANQETMYDMEGNIDETK